MSILGEGTLRCGSGISFITSNIIMRLYGSGGEVRSGGKWPEAGHEVCRVVVVLFDEVEYYHEFGG